jgi:hypothetical protein
VKPLPDTAVISFGLPACIGDTLHMYATSTTPGATFAWTGPLGFTDTGAHGRRAAITHAQSGWYNARAWLNGCAARPTPGKPVLFTSNVTPAVALSANPGGVVSAGLPITFQPVPTNGGPAPTYLWFVNGIPVANGSTYTTSGLINGDAVTVRMYSSEPCTNPDSVMSLPMVVQISTGITNAFPANDLTLFPSPNNGTFFVKGTVLSEEPVTLEVVDFTGRKISSSTEAAKGAKLNSRISLHDIPSGVYLLRISQAGITATAPFSIR